jgi:hypothetical protein
VDFVSHQLFEELPLRIPHLKSLKLFKTQHNVTPEKAGVGGSTPSLATILFKDLAPPEVPNLFHSVPIQI